MSYQIPVLYTEQKTKKVKIWLDGYLVPRATLNSARLISAGKHEIDVVFYSSIDDLKPGREFETDRYLITVEESHHDNQPIPRPSYAVQDPTMKNRPKSAAFVPPRLVPKPDPPPPVVSSIQSSMISYERNTPHQWGYAGITPAMKRQSHYDQHGNDDDDHANQSLYKQPSKLMKTSHFTPPAFQSREPPPAPPPLVQQQSKPSFTTSIEQPGLLSDHLIHQLMGQTRPPTTAMPKQPVSVQSETPAPTRRVSPPRPSNLISWSNWDEAKSDDEDDPSTSSSSHQINVVQAPATTNSKSMSDWHSLIQSTVPLRSIGNERKPVEAMPKFNFDEQTLDSLFEDVDEL